MLADVVLGVQYGDCGKGKVTHHLCKTGEYTHVIRFNGGCNAGHTIYHNEKKFVTHHIPAGVFFGIKSIIGPGCVVDPERFFEELSELKENGIDTEGLIYIAENTHVITREHKLEDSTDTRIGTTRRGNGPAYRDKYARKGKRAAEIESLKPFLINLYEELHSSDDIKILFEGAQGFGLDIDWGDYPYVTSSHCTTAGALLNGVPPQSINKVWGVAKVYETYVGAKNFEPDSDVFDMIRDIGREYGATTGRPRQCNWLNWDKLEKAARVNGVTDLVFNKVDILSQLNKWALIYRGEKIQFETEEEMKGWIEKKASVLPIKPRIYFSGDPRAI